MAMALEAGCNWCLHDARVRNHLALMLATRAARSQWQCRGVVTGRLAGTGTCRTHYLELLALAGLAGHDTVTIVV